MKPALTIDRKWLTRNYACDDGVAAFVRLFPRGAKFTPDNLRRAWRRQSLRPHFPWLLSELDMVRFHAASNSVSVFAGPPVRWRACRDALIEMAGERLAKKSNRKARAAA